MVAVAVVCGSLVVLGVAALVAYLTARGVDPAPVLQLASTAAAAVGSLGTLVLQLVGRRTATKTEKWAGQLASAVTAVRRQDPAPVVDDVVPVDQVDDDVVPATSWLPPVPPPARRGAHAWPTGWEEGGGPGGRE